MPKRPKPKQYDEDGNEIEEEEEEPEEAAEESPEFLSSCENDTLPGVPEDADAPPPPWIIREYKSAGSFVAVREAPAPAITLAGHAVTAVSIRRD
eukprot:SAG31_NODE_3983_length_3688_cov_5.820006_3_plen_95_part_00